MTSAGAYALLAIAILCSSIAQVFQKRAASELTHELTHHRGSPVLLLLKPNSLLSALFLGAGLVFWLLVLQVLPLSVAYPLLSVSYVVVMLLARWLFAERIPWQRWLGTGLIMLGVSVLVGA